jgi:hypothetical protein
MNSSSFKGRQKYGKTDNKKRKFRFFDFDRAPLVFLQARQGLPIRTALPDSMGQH